MSSGAYALIGVVVGGLLTAATQIGIGLFMSRRTERAEWKIASRLVTEELERLMNDLRLIIEGGATPSVPTDERFLSSAFWDEHHTVIARGLPNNDAGDDFWRGLARLHSTVGYRLRPMVESLPPGTKLAPSTIETLRDNFEAAWRAYESLTGVPPNVKPLPVVAE